MSIPRSVAFASAFYALLARYLPGDTTLNELRILTAVAAADVGGDGTSVSQISEETGISRATVSRLIGQWTEAGQVRESPHPADGRRRILGFTEKACRLNEEWAARLAEIFEASSESA